MLHILGIVQLSESERWSVDLHDSNGDTGNEETQLFESFERLQLAGGGRRLQRKGCGAISIDSDMKPDRGLWPVERACGEMRDQPFRKV